MQEEKMFDMGFTERRFPLNVHMCLIYNSESERKHIISKYLHAGLLGNEYVAYFADDITKSEVKTWLLELGIDSSSIDDRGNFHLKEANEIYCSHGYFSPEKMLNSLMEMRQEAITSDHHYLRLSGEMTWSLKGLPGSEKLIEYESRLNDLVNENPLIAICQYDANKFDGKTIYDVLQVHPYMIVKGQILNNPYYITPAEFLSKH